MEFDRALELAVIEAWDELIGPGNPRLIHIEYDNVPDLAVQSVELWTVRNGGYEDLICKYFISRNDPWAPRLHFSNKYRSQKLAEDLDFIMRNQRDFTRRSTSSVRALVQVSAPSTEDKRRAAGWKDSIGTSSVQTSRQMKTGREGRRGAAEPSRASEPDSAQAWSRNEARSGEPAKHGWPSDDDIRRRAYEIYERRGREPGHDLEDWLMAERELIEEIAATRKRTQAAKAS